MKKSQKLENRQNRRGFSLFEALVSVAAISSLAAVAYIAYTSTMPVSKESRLNRQVATLNASASMYRLGGGHFDPLATTTQIYAQLQLASDRAESEQIVGLSGSMVDPNLQAVLTNPEETGDPTIARVIWNPAAQKFVLTHEKKQGIKGFYMDTEGAAFRVVGTEPRLRGGAVNYNANGGWVWGYKETPVTRIGPTYIGGGSAGTSPPPTSPYPSNNFLDAPLVSTPEGTYPITSYQLKVTLGNPNPAGSSDVFYSVNHGPLRLYKGGVLTFGPNEFVATISKPRTGDWEPSTYRVDYYSASPVKLQAPIIRASSPGFSFDKHTDVHVTLNNPNKPGVSKIEYRIAGGSWTNYRGRSIKLRERDYQDGSRVEARALPIAEYYLPSDTSSRDISPAVAARLRPPVISFSAPAFSDKVDKIKVTLINQNPRGSSEIYYAITGPEASRDESEPLEFKKYRKKFERKLKDHKDGFAVIAYARAISRAYHDSANAEDEVGSSDLPDSPGPENPAGLIGGHFDLDTSSFIAEFHSGTTDAHVHEYDKKYRIPGADFFDLKGGKLHHITDDVPADARFKLIVVNPDLSPGGRLVINRQYDDGSPATWTPVQDYASLALEDLPVFSLNGAPGTTRLSELGLYFDVDAIANGDIVPTNTGDVRDNVPGKYGEWRNGALTIQAVRVNADNTDAFTTSLAVTSGGKHGGATGGLLWEATVFWHWDGPSYHESKNTFEPAPNVQVAGQPVAHTTAPAGR